MKNLTMTLMTMMASTSLNLPLPAQAGSPPSPYDRLKGIYRLDQHMLGPRGDTVFQDILSIESVRALETPIALVPTPPDAVNFAVEGTLTVPGNFSARIENALIVPSSRMLTFSLEAVENGHRFRADYELFLIGSPNLLRGDVQIGGEKNELMAHKLVDAGS